MAQIILKKTQLGQTCWQKELAQGFTDPVKLLDYLQLPPEDFASDIQARKLFPMRVPQPFAARIEKGNPQDPLLLQVLPVNKEFDEVEGFVADPLQEQETAMPGLLHKYKSRVLLMVRGGCAINCRYCFRRHFPYADNQLNKQSWPAVKNYLEQHPDINEVIFSGGDPLMANDRQIDWLIKQIETLPQIRRLRIHTRLPVVIPNRITTELLQTFAQTRLKVVMVMHINHAQEIDQALALASKSLKEAGVHLLNQAVILKNVNDSLNAQVALSETLFDAGIQPYYLFLLDKVAGAAHFDMAEQDAIALHKAMQRELPGFLVPKLSREIAGEASKTLIN